MTDSHFLSLGRMKYSSYKKVTNNLRSLEDYYDFVEKLLISFDLNERQRNVLRVDVYKSLRSFVRSKLFFFSKLIFLSFLSASLHFFFKTKCNNIGRKPFILEQDRKAFLDLILDENFEDFDTILVFSPVTYLKILFLKLFNKKVRKQNFLNLSFLSNVGIINLLNFFVEEAWTRKNFNIITSVSKVRVKKIEHFINRIDLHYTKEISTFADTHLFSAAIFLEAKKRPLIKTTVIQHGDIGAFHLPILAKNVKCWSQDHKQKYKNFGFDGDFQIIENPFYPKSCMMRDFTKRKKVILYVTRHSHESENWNFRIFANVSVNNTMEFIIKLRPDASILEYLKYYFWIKKFTNKKLKIFNPWSKKQPLLDPETLCICTSKSSVIDEAHFVGIPVAHLMFDQEIVDELNDKIYHSALIYQSSDLKGFLTDMSQDYGSFERIRNEQLKHVHNQGAIGR